MTDATRKKIKLEMLHNDENRLNKEMGEIDKAIKELVKRKKMLQRLISNNMRYRNDIINGIK